MYRILIEAVLDQVQIAFVDGEVLEHYFLERNKGVNNYGNIYMGKVEQIKPGIQGAFVNINSEKNALLHSSEIIGGKDNPIDQLLKRGQQLIVQVKKESVGDKGAKLTTKLSISGRYLVLLPTESRIYCSRKIKNADERTRLKGIIEELKPKNCGIIIRTEAEGIDLATLKRDLDYLLKRLEKVNSFEKGPKLLLSEESNIIKIIRDYYTQKVDEIITNDKDILNEIKNYFDFYFPEKLDTIKFVNTVDLMEHCKIKKEIEKLYKRKIYLKSGGYIVIDYTEACTVIDVNSGSFIGKTKEDTFMNINLEATEVIADQLRLRNIGGIIIIDYINIGGEKEQNTILSAMNKALKQDKVKTKVYGFTKLGMLQMTRKREGKSLNEIYYDYCPTCNGIGQLPNQDSLLYKSIYAIERDRGILDGGSISIKMHPILMSVVDTHFGKTFVDRLKDKYRVKVFIEADNYLEVDQIKIVPKGIN